ncbi:MAG: sulfite exporter TauE/SafE family protein [Clostridia bacterium]|nr:sulfite exporter TauE/SafE family protein [Clostridia bacterium]
MSLFDIIAAVVSGMAASLGIGGGGILIIYLTLFASMEQLKAQGLNLLFFIPCGIIALIIHLKNKLIDKAYSIPLICGGVVGVLVGNYLSTLIDTNILSKIFAVFIIFIGLRELLTKPKIKEKK